MDMKGFSRVIFVFFASLLAGSSIFMSFVVAPVAFRRFPKELAGDITGALFPAYFAVQIASSLLLIISLLPFFIRGHKSHITSVIFAGVILFSASLNLFAVLPQAREYRGNEKYREEFRREHSKSMILNLAAVLASAGIIVLIPRSLNG